MTGARHVLNYFLTSASETRANITQNALIYFNYEQRY